MYVAVRAGPQGRLLGLAHTNEGVYNGVTASHNRTMAITRRSVLASALGLPAAFAAPPAAPADWTPLFDGKSLKGWKITPFSKHTGVDVKDGMIVIGKGSLTGINLAGQFPHAGYEIRFEAARLDGNDFFAGITFPVNDTYCTWINGGWGGTTVGLSSLDGDDASENDTNTARDFVNGRWYAFHLAVTETRIQCWIDGKVAIDADIAGRRVGLRPGEMDLSTPLGFATYWTVAGLRKIEYRRYQPAK